MVTYAKLLNKQVSLEIHVIQIVIRINQALVIFHNLKMSPILSEHMIVLSRRLFHVAKNVSFLNVKTYSKNMRFEKLFSRQSKS